MPVSLVHWLAPTQEAHRVAEPEHHRGEPCGDCNDARRPPAEPAAENLHHVGHRIAFGADDLQDVPGRRGWVEEEQDRGDEIVEMHHLQRPGVRQDGQHRQGRETAEERAPAIGGPAKHD
jgi:hypothetical protein